MKTTIKALIINSWKTDTLIPLEIEEETGDYFYRARYYDPSVRRFLSEDPIGFSGSDFNLYNYSENEPVRLKYPFGLYVCMDPPIGPVYPLLNIILFKGGGKVAGGLNKIKNSNRFIRIGKGKFPSPGSKRISIGGQKAKN